MRRYARFHGQNASYAAIHYADAASNWTDDENVFEQCVAPQSIWLKWKMLCGRVYGIGCVNTPIGWDSISFKYSVYIYLSTWTVNNSTIVYLFEIFKETLSCNHCENSIRSSKNTQASRKSMCKHIFMPSIIWVNVVAVADDVGQMFVS